MVPASTGTPAATASSCSRCIWSISAALRGPSSSKIVETLVFSAGEGRTPRRGLCLSNTRIQLSVAAHTEHPPKPGDPLNRRWLMLSGGE